MKGHIINDISFTEAEFRILSCLACHVTQSKVIGSILGSSPKTINTHIDNIKRKIKVHNKYEIIAFLKKYKQINQLKASFNNRYIDHQFTKAAKIIAHRLSILNVKCICNISPKLNENIEVNKICDSIGSLAIKLEHVDGLQTLLDNSSSLNTNKFALLVAESTDEIYHFKRHTIDISNNIIYICLEQQPLNTELTDDPKVLFYDQNNRKVFYHFIIKYLMNNFPDVKKLDQELNLLSSIDDIEKNIHSNDDIDQSVKQELSYNFFSTKNIWIIIILICISMLCIIWYKSVLTNQPITNTKHENKISNILVYNLPSRNIEFVGRDNAFKKIKDNLNKTKIGVITQCAVGSGGIGKTQLLTEYAHRAIESTEYDAILWINASTANSIDSSYEEIANNLGIDITNMNPTSIKKYVHSTLLNKHKVKRVLFILDNAPKAKDVEQYLAALHKQWSINAKVHILISSRSQHWSGSTLILDVFTEKEAKEFVKKSLPNAKEKDILKLIKTFNYYPLALGQAVGYIKQHTNIDDYIKIYLNENRQHLDKSIGDLNNYTKTLWNVLSITIPKLNNNSKKILYMSSYLESNIIQLDIFDLPIIEKSEAIKQLRDHSLITMINSGTAFRIHALLQEIIRRKIINNSKWFNISVKLAMKAGQDFDIQKQATWSKARQWLIHINSLSTYLSKHIESSNLLDKYGKIAQFFGMYNLAYDVLTSSLSFQKEMYKNSEDIKLVDTLGMLGELELKREDYASAKKIYQQILQIKENYYKNPNHIELYNTLNSLGTTELKLGFYKKAKSLYQRSLKIQKQYYNDVNHIELSDTLFGLGMVERYFGYYEEAKLLFQQALYIKKVHYKDPEQIELTDILLQIGVAEFYLGNFQKFKDIFEKVLKIQQKAYEHDNILTFYTLQGLGVIEWRLGNYQKAKKIFQQVLDIHTKHYEDPKHIASAITILGLGLVAFSTGRYEEARDLLEKDLNIRRKHYKSSNHISFGDSLHALAMTNELLENYDIALKYMNQAYEVLYSHYKDRLSEVLYMDYSPIITFPDLNPKNKEKTIAYYKKSLDIIIKTYSNKHHLVARYYYLLGQSYELNGQNNKAIDQYRLALDVAKEIAFKIKEKEILTKYQKNILKIESRLSKLVKQSK